MNARPLVVVTDHLAEAGVEKPVLDGIADVLLLQTNDEDDVIRRGADADILLVYYDICLSERVIAALPRCRAIIRCGVGFDNVDLQAAGSRGIVVCNVPDYGTEEVADHAILLLLATTRRLLACDAAIRAGTWEVAPAMGTPRLRGRTLGLIGLGRIGTATAMRAKAFGLRVVFYDPLLPDGVDVVPGHNNQMWLEADNPGDYSGQCTQFCGTSHAFMRFRVMSQTSDDFDGWVAAQKAPPVAPTADTQAGAMAFAQGACIGCHTIQGVSQGKVGPNLTHFASRTTFAGSSLPNQPEDVAKWIKNPQSVKPEAKMPKLPLDDNTIADLVKYLETLK